MGVNMEMDSKKKKKLAKEKEQAIKRYGEIAYLFFGMQILQDPNFEEKLKKIYYEYLNPNLFE